MSELLRTRDCVVLVKGDAYGVTVEDSFAQEGWQGGSGVQWAPPTKDVPTVKRSDGYYSGFLLWGSDESSDQFTAMTGQFPHYRYAVMGSGGWHILTSSYEKYTWASRQLGPLVPIVYNASDRLVFSLRGFFTKEDEWSLSGDPRAPNNYYIAFVTQVPSAATQNYLGIQVSI